MKVRNNKGIPSVGRSVCCTPFLVHDSFAFRQNIGGEDTPSQSSCCEFYLEDLYVNKIMSLNQ